MVVVKPCKAIRHGQPLQAPSRMWPSQAHTESPPCTVECGPPRTARPCNRACAPPKQRNPARPRTESVVLGDSVV